MHDFEPRRAVERLRRNAETLEVVEDVALHALEPGLRRADAVGLHAEAQVLRLDEAVVALRVLVLQKGFVLAPDGVEVVAARRDANAAGKALAGCGEVHERELKADGAVEVVEKIAPRIEDRSLVLLLAELIVDVLKADGF